mgnify:CR=1 FL=1
MSLVSTSKDTEHRAGKRGELNEVLKRLDELSREIPIVCSCSVSNLIGISTNFGPKFMITLMSIRKLREISALRYVKVLYDLVVRL